MFFEDFNTLLHTTVLNWLPCAQRNGVSRVCSNWKKINDEATLRDKYSLLIQHPLRFKREPIFPLHTFFNLKEILIANPTLKGFSEEGKEILYPFAVLNNIIPLTPAIDKNMVFVLAAALGNKQKLVELAEEVSINVQNEAFRMAAQFGELGCLEYLDNEKISDQDGAFQSAAGTYGTISFSGAITWNNFPCLKYLFEKHPDKITFLDLEVAIISTSKQDQHLSSLKYLCEFLERNAIFFSEGKSYLINNTSSFLCREYLYPFFTNAEESKQRLASMPQLGSATQIEDLIRDDKTVAEVVKKAEPANQVRSVTFSCSPS